MRKGQAGHPGEGGCDLCAVCAANTSPGLLVLPGNCRCEVHNPEGHGPALGHKSPPQSIIWAFLCVLQALPAQGQKRSPWLFAEGVMEGEEQVARQMGPQPPGLPPVIVGGRATGAPAGLDGGMVGRNEQAG